MRKESVAIPRMKKTSKKKADQQPEVQSAVAALTLFEKNGFEHTTVEQLAEATGMSRRTFFRQFHSKEDIVFIDHEILLPEIATYLSDNNDRPWHAVLESARKVFHHFNKQMEFSRLRYRVVRAVPELRDREIVTVVRYERMYSEFLRAHLPDDQHLKAIMFASSITSAHNYVLRKTLRGEEEGNQQELEEILAQVAELFSIPTADDATKTSGLFTELHRLLHDLENTIDLGNNTPQET